MNREVRLSPEEKSTPVSWDRLVELAIEDTKDSWEEIDAAISSIANDRAYVSLATANLEHENPKVRDLAASILEGTTLKITQETADLLFFMIADDNLYVRFRAACALVKHHKHLKFSRDIKKVLEEALDDEDEEVKAIAQQRLAELEQQVRSS